MIIKNAVVRIELSVQAYNELCYELGRSVYALYSFDKERADGLHKFVIDPLLKDPAYIKEEKNDV